MSALFYDELVRGQRFDAAPAVTLTDGFAAAHQSIVGNRLLMSLDETLSRRVTGAERRVAHPALVWDVAIGQSTVVTQRVIANLFYRGLTLRRAPLLGDTLRTTTEILALRDLSERPGRSPGGLAALHIVTVDRNDKVVLDFVRCAMLPLSPDGRLPGHADDLDAERPTAIDEPPFIDEWNLGAHPKATRTLERGDRLTAPFGDVVSSAPELARLTLNLAGAHHDARAGLAGERLVYGGHTIGLALLQLNRLVPTLVYILGWVSCEHPGPVREGDSLLSSIEVEDVQPAHGVSIVEFVVRTSVVADGRNVLRWRLRAVVA